METLLNKEAFFKKRWFILSGLFVRDVEEIGKRLKRGSIRIAQRIQEQNWVTFVGSRGDSEI
jgi:ribosomal protein L11 methylase PrmA